MTTQSGPSPRPVEQILDLARWAPSGDNTQPWWFEIVDDRRVVVHGFDTRDHCVYDLDGRPSQISVGALLETASIAASAHGWAMDVSRRLDFPDTQPTFDLTFRDDPRARIDPLLDSIPRRSVQRRRLRTRPLSGTEKNQLESAVGDGYEVIWLEGAANRRRAALLMFSSAKLRLTMPEAYTVHRDVIEWNARFSEERVPDQALGADILTTRLMRFVMQSWQRVRFFNRFMAGTWVPRIQMDLIPALACGAHFVLRARNAPSSIDEHVRIGRALQRFWLTCTSLGLQMQPELTPLIFARYARTGVRFSQVRGMSERAAVIARRLESLVGPETAERGVFMGRVGAGEPAQSRSVRLPLARLLVRRP